MADTTPRNIVLKGWDFCIQNEGVAGGTVTPGHLVKDASGTITVHNVAGGNVLPRFADRADDMDAGGISDNYASGDTTKYVIPQRGVEIYALLSNEATLGDVTAGDPLESAGDGTLRKHVASAQAVNEGGAATYTVTQTLNKVVGYALETIANAGQAAVVRLKIVVA